MKKGSLDTLVQVFICPHDPADLLQQAVMIVEELEGQHPGAFVDLAAIDVSLKSMALLPKATNDDYATVISAVLQAINSVKELPFVTEELQAVLGRYLRFMVAKQAMLKEMR